ncbi:hypothetical protein RWH43_16825 [Microbacterium sp. KSW2-21]|uniref:Uncharacterized protein n=1 Tax=Microbacterium algihabitans TaxID=3075992 RepID=A0ABU3RZV7_9MICO|nr:hypothetical protein [Microbacterium sp. KSW2-21]MDU0328425.1 hypothetical protein [Microbacterium sp. KSW2-21]
MSTWSRRARVIGVAIVVAVVATCGLWFGRLLFDSQWTLTLHELLENTGVENPSVTEPRDITRAACGETVDCVEAYDTAEATYYRFGSRGAAERFEATVGDGFRSNYIVMDFAEKTDVSMTEQLWAMQYLAGTWQDYEGSFPNRLP